MFAFLNNYHAPLIQYEMYKCRYTLTLCMWENSKGIVSVDWHVPHILLAIATQKASILCIIIVHGCDIKFIPATNLVRVLFDPTIPTSCFLYIIIIYSRYYYAICLNIQKTL